MFAQKEVEEIPVLSNSAEQPIRIAHIVGKTVRSGVETFVINYYRHINRNRYQFDLIVDADSTYSWEEEVNVLGGRVYTVAPYQDFFENQKDLTSLFRKNQYKIVHSHLNSLSIFPLMAAQQVGVPIRIAHSHSTAGKGEFKRNCMKHILRPFAKVFPTDLWASSAHSAKWLFGERYFTDGNVRILKYAIETDKFTFNAQIRDKIRKQYQIKNQFVIGHIGRFNNQKNHDFLIDIFAEIHQLKPDSVLLLIGNGPLLPIIKEKVSRLNLTPNVIFAGIQKEPADFYQAMDVFLFPSLYEGLGIVGIEAQASGLPVIASTCVPKELEVTDLVRFLSLNSSPCDWATETLKFGLDYPRNDTHEEIISAGYDISKEAAQLENFYADCLFRMRK